MFFISLVFLFLQLYLEGVSEILEILNIVRD